MFDFPLIQHRNKNENNKDECKERTKPEVSIYFYSLILSSSHLGTTATIANCKLQYSQIN